MLELNAAYMSLQPADLGFERMKPVEFYPDEFAQSRYLDEFNPAPFPRSVENASPKALDTGTAQPNFRDEGDAVGPTRS